MSVLNNNVHDHRCEKQFAVFSNMQRLLHKILDLPLIFVQVFSSVVGKFIFKKLEEAFVSEFF
jgi:hypothetical protein